MRRSASVFADHFIQSGFDLGPIILESRSNPVELFAGKTGGGNIPAMLKQGDHIALNPGAVFQFLKQSGKRQFRLRREIDLLFVGFKAIKQILIDRKRGSSVFSYSS